MFACNAVFAIGMQDDQQQVVDTKQKYRPKRRYQIMRIVIKFKKHTNQKIFGNVNCNKNVLHHGFGLSNQFC